MIPSVTGEPLRARLAAGLLAGLLLLAGSVMLGLALGSRHLPIADVWAALTGGGTGDTPVIIWEQRLPRTLLALAVGASLAVAGVLAQGLTRNPLADPGLLGVSAGAALAVVLAIRFLGADSLPAHIAAAVTGAAVAGAVVVTLAGCGARRSPTTLAVAGVAVSALLASLTTVVVLLDARTLDEYRFWAVGAVSGRGADVATAVLPVLGSLVLLALLAGRWLDGLALGDDAAAGLGLRLPQVRVALGAVVVLLTGTAVAVTGPIGFVGLAVPHAARTLTGARHGWLLPYAAVLGGSLLVVADVVGRVVVRPAELQVGIVTALVGGPAVLLLLRRLGQAR